MSDENTQQLNKILEGAILAAGEPLSLAKLQTLFDEDEMPAKDILHKALEEIKASCGDRGFDLIEVASGWRFQVREDLAQWVNRLWEEKPQKYSRALLETMSLIAYRQPLTRGDIEEVRGVAVSSHIIKTLTERGWVKVVGHRDVPGRPALYATTKGFLDYFNLKSLDELPSLGELKDIDSLNQDLEFGILEPAAAPTDQTAEAEDILDTESVYADDENKEEGLCSSALENTEHSAVSEVHQEVDEDGDEGEGEEMHALERPDNEDTGAEDIAEDTSFSKKQRIAEDVAAAEDLSLSEAGSAEREDCEESERVND